MCKTCGTAADSPCTTLCTARGCSTWISETFNTVRITPTFPRSFTHLTQLLMNTKIMLLTSVNPWFSTVSTVPITRTPILNLRKTS